MTGILRNSIEGEYELSGYNGRYNGYVPGPGTMVFSALRSSLMNHHIVFLLSRSMITVRYIQPSLVSISVISDTLTGFSCDTLKFRSNIWDYRIIMVRVRVVLEPALFSGKTGGIFSPIFLFR